MSKSFEDLLSKVSECEMKKVAVAVAQDSAVLEAKAARLLRLEANNSLCAREMLAD